MPIAKFRSACGCCQAPIAPPVPQAPSTQTTFYRCLLCPSGPKAPTTSDLCGACFARRAPLPSTSHAPHPHTFLMGQLSASSITWLPPPPAPQQQSLAPSLPVNVIASLQGRELGDGDYDLLLQLDAPNRIATSLPHYLLSLLAHVEPNAVEQIQESEGARIEVQGEGEGQGQEAQVRGCPCIRQGIVTVPDPCTHKPNRFIGAQVVVA